MISVLLAEVFLFKLPAPEIKPVNVLFTEDEYWNVAPLAIVILPP